jgi:hypothetical protein
MSLDPVGVVPYWFDTDESAGMQEAVGAIAEPLDQGVVTVVNP